MLFEEGEINSYGLRKKMDRKKKRMISKLEKQGILIGKDPIKLLKKTQKTEQNNEGTDEVKTKWRIAMLKAQGYKVKDDISLLKKSANKVRKIKRRKYEKWQDRIKTVEENKKQRQSKRAANIQARRDRKLSKKLKKARGKGRIFSAESV